MTRERVHRPLLPLPTHSAHNLEIGVPLKSLCLVCSHDSSLVLQRKLASSGEIFVVAVNLVSQIPVAEAEQKQANAYGIRVSTNDAMLKLTFVLRVALWYSCN